MDSDPLSLDLAFIFILIVANGIFAMTEIAIVSARKARLKRRAEQGSHGARVALELAGEPTQLLSTVQVGITLIGIFTGALGGSTIAAHLSVYIKKVSFLAQYSDVISLVIVVSVITYLSLIVGELVPKRLALNDPESAASALAVPMRVFANITQPVVRFLSFSTDAVLRILQVKESQEPPVTEEEVRFLISQGAKYGTFEKTEQEIFERVFRLGNMRAGSLMTPRTQVDWLDIGDTEEQNMKLLTESRHSRFPVAKENLDNIIGVVYTKDLLACRISGESFAIKDSIKEPLFIPKSMGALQALELFKQSGNHIALVVDEYGGMQGLVTMNDILEQIVGEMPQDDELFDPEITYRADGSWLLDGLLPVEEFKGLLQLRELPGEERERYQTLGGFILSYLGHIPAAAEKFEWNSLRFEVVAMDRIRVDKVLVTRISNQKTKDDTAEQQVVAV